MMNKSNLKTFWVSLVAILFLLVVPFVAKAADELDVEYLNGQNVGDEIFKDKNIYPGWSTSETINVENESDENSVLYFKINVNGDKDLAEVLKLYIIRTDDDNYRIGGEGDRWTLREANEEDLYVDKLNPGESEDYKVKIKFDEDASNDYQGEKLSFDIDFILESENAGLSEEEILAGQGREVSGEEPEEEVQGVSTSSEEEGRGNGETAGQEASCQSWPMWAWILALVVFIAVLIYQVRRKYNEKKIVWGFPVVWTIIGLIFWQQADFCQEFGWFWKSILISAIIIFGIYLYFFRKKTENNIESAD